MSRNFSSERKALGICDRCGLSYKLRTLRKENDNREEVDIRVCKYCWDPDHPQNHIEELKINDPRPLKEPRYEITDGAAAEYNQTAWEFNVDGGDWYGTFVTLVVSVENGTISLTPSGSSQGFMVRSVANGNQLALTASDYNYLRVNVARTDGTQPVYDMSFHWKRTTDSDWDLTTGRVLHHSGPDFSGSEPERLVVFNLRNVTDWDGTIEEVRLYVHSDTSTGSGGTGAVANLDYIRFEEF